MTLGKRTERDTYFKMSKDSERAALLENDSEDDDDFFLHGPSTSAIKSQISEVTSIAKNNLQKLAEREERLDSLEERSVRLDDTASNFRAGAYTLKRKAWWQHAKYKAVGAAGLVILLFLLIIIIMAKKGE